jgi:hypothetical protein
MQYTAADRIQCACSGLSSWADAEPYTPNDGSHLTADENDLMQLQRQYKVQHPAIGDHPVMGAVLAQSVKHEIAEG